jgi:hypothetical protein
MDFAPEPDHMDNLVFKSVAESAVRAALIAIAGALSVEVAPDTIGRAATGGGFLLVFIASLVSSAWRHKKNIYTTPPNKVVEEPKPTDTAGSSSRIGPLLVLALVGVLSIGIVGCQSVGPVRTVGTVKTSNDPLNASSVVEGADASGNPVIAWNDSTNGPVSTVKQTTGENLVRKTGQVTREISWRDGERQLLISTGADITAEAVSVDPATGVLSIGKFGTSSSEPIRALNESLDRYQSVWSTLSQEQRAAIEAQFDAIKVISPDLFDVISKAIGL